MWSLYYPHQSNLYETLYTWKLLPLNLNNKRLLSIYMKNKSCDCEQVKWKVMLLYLRRVIGQMPIFRQKDPLEVSWEKDYLMPKGAWILFEIQDASYIQSRSAPLAIEVTTSTEKGSDEPNKIYDGAPLPRISELSESLQNNMLHIPCIIYFSHFKHTSNIGISPHR